MSARTVVRPAKTVSLKTPTWMFNAMITEDAVAITMTHHSGSQIQLDKASLEDACEFSGALDAAIEEFRGEQPKRGKPVAARS